MNNRPQFLLATRSIGKIREIRQILRGDSRVRIVTLDELGIEPTAAEESIETFDTFRENAMAKALYFAGMTGKPTIADDSGLAVDALTGAPGVRSKRFAERPGLSGIELDQANNQLLLRRLQGVSGEDRGAHYACVAALALPDRPVCSTIGTCSGLITNAPRGREGFGYDPLFLVPELGLTFAEVDAVEKNRRSHRARAFHALGANLSYLTDTAAFSRYRD